MKKLMASLVIIALIICQIPFSVFAANSNYITAEDISGNVGDKVTLEIKTKTNMSVDDINLEVSYDNTSLSVTETDVVGEESLPNMLAGINGNLVTMGAYANDSFNIASGTSILKIGFTILKAGTNSVTIDLDAYDTDSSTSYLEKVTAKVTGAEAPKPATGISLNKEKTTIEKGKTEKLTATVEPSDAADKTVEWVTSNSSVATVENDGTVTAKNKGTATITAKTVNNHTADCVVTVTNPVQSIFIKKNGAVCKSETIDKDEEITLTAEVNPSDADDKTVTWTSSEPSVASVNNGVVKGLSKGSTIITAKTSNGKEATCSVTVGIGLKSISLNETEKTIKNGEEYTFSVIYNPEDTDLDKTINWSSSNPEVATVDNNGKVTVHKCTGTATITATVNADNTKTASAVVTAAHKDDKLTLHEAKEATCSAEGNKAYYTCSGCQDYYEDSTGSVKITDKESVILSIDSTAHDWDEGRTTKDATCTEAGEKTYTCKIDSKHTKIEPISALGHNMTKHNAKAETCEEDGNIDYYTCSRCNKIFKDETGNVEITQEQTVIKAKGHDWGEWAETTPATYEAEGKETRTCKNDSTHTETRSIPKLHKHELTKTEAKEATCIAEGNKEYWTCSICNKTFSDSEGKTELEDVVIPINNEAHDWEEWKTTKEPSCTEKGSKTRVCKRDSKHTETEEIDMLAHTLTKVDEVKATCDAEGNKAYYKCSVCDKYFEDETATTEITDKTSVITPALGHDYDEGIVTTPKTCTTDGVKTYTCKHDSKHTITETIPAGHDWNEWVITKEATVDEAGERTRTCKLDSKHTETEEIARIPYAIEEGNGQTHYYNEDKGIEITANGTLNKLVRLLVDGTTELSEDDVDLQSGSTIAILKPTFLDTLSEGQHTLTFEYTDGSINALFNVAKVTVPEEEKTSDTTENSVAEQEKTDTTTTTKKSSSPKTGDNIIIWISLLAVSILGILAIAKIRRKRNK